MFFLYIKKSYYTWVIAKENQVWISDIIFMVKIRLDIKVKNIRLSKIFLYIWLSKYDFLFTFNY